MLQLMRAGHCELPADTALLLIHALTPWGFAWQRRCDAEGVDLNRNCVDFKQAPPENTGYMALREAIFSENLASRRAVFTEFSVKFGRAALEIAISGGQYQDADGPFYGGRTAAHGRRVCEALIADYGLFDRRLAVIDLHTGLGAYGYGEIICDHPPTGGSAQTAFRWYGDALTLPLAGTSSSVPKLGLLDYLWHAAMNEESCYITLEFGTFSTDCLFEVLLRDHQLWALTDSLQQRQAHSQIMRRHFCPDDPAWQELVIFRARQVFFQALAGISS